MVPKRKQLSGMALLPALMAAAVQSQAQTGEQQPIEEVAVWGTQVFASSVDMDEQAIAIKQADHISDLLRGIPGVDVGGAHSLNQRISIRSMDDKNLRITIDGANQNTYMYHHMGNLQIHADILQSVDIQVGNNSVVDGGLGGTVRFKTKEARDMLAQDKTLGGRLQASYATNASESFAATGYGTLGEKADFLVYYNGINRGNYEVGGGEIKNAEGDVIEGTDGEVRGLEGDLSDALIKFGYNINDNQRIKIGYERYKDEGDYSYRPDMGLATDLAIANNLGLPLTYDTKFSRDTLTLNYDLSWGADNTLAAALFRNVSNLNRDERAIAELWPGEPAQVEGEAVNTGFNLLGTSTLNTGVEQTLTYGIDAIRYETDYIADGINQSGETAHSRALFIEDELRLGSFYITPGVRYNQYSLDSTVVDDDFNELTTALAVEYQISSAVMARLSVTELFKGPEISETFTGAGLGEVANPGIRAEGGTNTELAIAYDDTVLGADRFTAGVTFFETQITDFIYDYAPPANPDIRYWKDNVGDMTIDGYEFYVGYDLGNFSSLLSVSTADSELDAFDEYASLDGNRLDRQQGDPVTLDINYDLPQWNATLHWDVQRLGDVDGDDALDSASLENSKQGYTVHNISARWQPALAADLTLTFGVDNLFDEYYASHSSRTGVSNHPRFGELYLLDYEPGRNIKFTAALQF